MTESKATSKTNSYHHGDLASELIKAAETELSENGIEAFSLRAVAKRAGVSHGAPAHHFKNVKGLLTALATTGYQRFVECQNVRQDAANTDPKSQSIASGLGYIDFAMQNPALFRLMFASDMPDRSNANFKKASLFAFNKLVADVQSVRGSDPYADRPAMIDVVSSWAIAHGLADLIISGRLERPLELSAMPQRERDKILTNIMIRASSHNT